MYAYIKGTIKQIQPTGIVLDNYNIGYLILVANPFSFNIGENITLYTHQYLRENINNLYGFETNELKDLFLKLITVSGVGPKTALGLLTTNDNLNIINAIENGDLNYLTKFPGIGKKTASQIILDLKGKFEVNLDNNKLNDTRLALSALGYSKSAIDKVLISMDLNLSTENQVKFALSKLLV